MSSLSSPNNNHDNATSLLQHCEYPTSVRRPAPSTRNNNMMFQGNDSSSSFYKSDVMGGDGYKNPFTLFESVSDSQTSKKIKKPPKSVSFYRKVHVKIIQHANTMPLSEIQEIWYIDDDYLEFEQNCRYTIKLMARRDIETLEEQSTEICVRGLECRIGTAAKRRSQRKRNVWEAVLGEQQLQRKDGIYAPMYLAQASEDHSYVSAIEAHRRALLDEAAIEQYLSATSKDVLVTKPSRRPTCLQTTTTATIMGMEGELLVAEE